MYYAAAPAQAPAPQAITLTNPSLLNRLIGTFGEHLAQKKNPRVQMAQAPAMAPAPAPAPAQYYAAASPTAAQAYGYMVAPPASGPPACQYHGLCSPNCPYSGQAPQAPPPGTILLAHTPVRTHSRDAPPSGEIQLTLYCPNAPDALRVMT